MKINFETIGNATLIISENDTPILSTDPWFDNHPVYFGSWKLTHEFPKKQRMKVENSKYIFISHFHPDHLNLASLSSCKESTILIAQHYGSRVENDLRRIGFKVICLPARKWIDIGYRTRIMLFKNEIQDSALLIELKDNTDQKSLILNLNDSGGYGFEKEVASISKKYKNSFYLQLHSWGCADMINLFNQNGKRILPLAANKFPVGRDIKEGMKRFNCNISIPFSCHHQYQRRDSYWANKYVTPLNLMSEGFVEDYKHILLPAFQDIELSQGTFLNRDINPKEIIIKEPVNESEFGDQWSELLTKKQAYQCQDYFSEIKTIFKNYKSIVLNVGGVDHEMLITGKGNAKLKFFVPRSSLMKAIRREIFDDLLIGNFMKTQLINCKNLYNPDFTMAVCKYSDNGGAKLNKELKNYFKYYSKDRTFEDKLNLNFLKLRAKIKPYLGNNAITKLKYLIRK